MGLTKQYLRYVPAGNFNIIASSKSNISFVTLEGQEGRFVAVGVCEHIFVWDLRLGEKAQVLSGEISVVTAICASPNKRHLAAGYSNGNVQVYDLKSADVVAIFSGHKSEITIMSYDNFGHKLATGSKDTDIVIWDTVAEIGICRLSGHQGAITQLQFMKHQSVLISSSKDTLIKFWDLDTQHCFKSLTGHHTEVWAFALMKEDQYLITGCSDAELRIWKLSPRDTENENKNPTELLTSKLNLDLTADDELMQPIQCHKAGSLLRSGRGRVVSMFSDTSGQILGCHGTDSQIELFQILSEEDSILRLKKRLKKERKKAQNENKDVDVNLQLSLRDEIKRLSTIKVSFKPSSLDLVLGSGGEVRIATVLSNNTIEMYSLQTSQKNSEAVCLRSVKNHGHHSNIRAVCFSSDNLAIVSGSTEALKIWNRPSQTALRTVDADYVLSVIFVPGDRHVLAGLKSGTLLIIDIAAGDILEEVAAHTLELWSISLMPDLRGCVTGGGDKCVRFWQFELITDQKSESKAKVLSLLHTRTLKLDDAVLCVKLSSSGKFVAVALMDSTVKIFFLDTFKFYLSLYGHKLPVLCMDISSDSSLIATGSSDRNIKIWGMDFGDCHKSIFAHDDAVTGLQFVPKTHYFFTCGKDGKIKQWNADNFDKIITLQGHVGEAWGLAVSPSGQFVVSCGADNVLRLYEKSDQILVLEDEQEEEREKEEALATDDIVVPGQPGLNLPSKKTIGCEKAAENILECLEISKQYKEQLIEYEALQAASSQTLPLPVPPPLMLALNVSTVEDYFLETMKQIRSSDMEEALILLPFSAVCEVLQLIPLLIDRGDNTELLCKVSMFLLKIHHAPIIANHSLLPIMQKLQKIGMSKVRELRDLVGYNFYAMQFVQKEIENAEGIQLFKDATVEKNKKQGKRKKKENMKRAIMTLS